MRDKGIPLPGDFSTTSRLEANLKKIDTLLLTAEINDTGKDGSGSLKKKKDCKC
jgi:hypothetical protein